MEQVGTTQCRVVVFGSANEDLVLSVAGLPGAGATVLASSSVAGPGGKGANQAVAAAREGGTVAFVGAVGDDERGARLLENLSRQQVDVSRVRRLSSPTGLAVVVVAADGGNLIVVAPGANGEIEPIMVDSAIDGLTAGDVVLLQCEVSREVVEHVILRVAATGAQLVLNLAPFVELDRRVLRFVDLLIVNEVEARSVLGDDDLLEPADLAAAVRLALDCDTIVTLGAHGSVLAANESTLVIPAVFVDEVVDTTGAGDVYVGALAASLVAGLPIADAMDRATARAAESVAIRGAQSRHGAYQLN